MTQKQELINRVREYFNLNIYETKVWLALLSRGIASAGEIAEMSGVPRSRTYDVLESIEKGGFVVMKLGKPVKYIAVKPDIVVEKLKTNVLRTANEKIEDIKRLKEKSEYNELNQLYHQGIKPVKQNEISGAIKGKSTIYSHIKDLLENAKKEAVICTSVKEMSSKLKFFSLTFERLRKNNVKIKIALSGDKSEIEKVSKKLKIKISHINVDTKFFIADNEQVLFTISNNHNDKPYDDSNGEEIAVWLNTPFFTSTLSYLFDMAIKG